MIVMSPVFAVAASDQPMQRSSANRERANILQTPTFGVVCTSLRAATVHEIRRVIITRQCRRETLKSLAQVGDPAH
jgi:hypothetical protein